MELGLRYCFGCGCLLDLSALLSDIGIPICDDEAVMMSTYTHIHTDVYICDIYAIYIYI